MLMKNSVESGGKYKGMAEGMESKESFSVSDVPPEICSPAGS